jgi:hypothetical protein
MTDSNKMTEQERRLWLMVRRGLLLICAALRKENAPLYAEMRRGLLMVCGAIERECEAVELV